MHAAWYRSLCLLRQRRRATLLLILLVGLIGGMVLTTFAGARRASTAYDRYRSATLAGDLDVAPGEVDPASFDAIARLPQVAAMTRTSYPFIVPAGSGLYPFIDFLAFAPMDREFGRTIDAPRMIDGRLADPDRSDEFAITEVYAEEAGLSVGDVVDFDSYAPNQVDALFSSGDAGAPAVILTVTGVLAAPDFLSESQGSFQPRAFLSVAFDREYAGVMGVYPGGVRVRLRNGAADVPPVVDAVRRIYDDDPELELQEAGEITDKISDSLDAIVNGLLLWSLCAGLAGAVLIGQTLTRHLTDDPGEGRTLGALGMARRHRTASLWLTALPVAAGGAALATVVAVLASVLMPVGLAREAEPDPGLSVDAPVLVVGGVAVAAIVAGLAALAAAGVTRNRESSAARRRSPSVGTTLAQLRMPLPSVVGVDIALDPAPTWAGRARAGLAGVAFGVAGLVAALVVSASAAELVRSPERYGFPWHAVASGFADGLVEEHGEELIADPTVAALGELTTSLARIGTDDVNLHAVDALKGDPGPTLISGRLPERAGEVALGSKTMADAGVVVGDQVQMSGPNGRRDLVVVGQAAFPVIDDRSSVERGAILTVATLEDLATEQSLNRDLVVTWTDGVDAERANGELAERLETEVAGERTPADIVNLRRIESLPRVMAAVLAVFAAVAASHSLITATRRRRHDLAVLRSLGFLRRQFTATMAAQAAAVAAAGLVIGIPSGIVVGSVVWRASARGIGVVDRPVTPWWALGIVVIAAILIANAAVLIPSRSVKRGTPAAILGAAPA